jgi:hypothetical protein
MSAIRFVVQTLVMLWKVLFTKKGKLFRGHLETVLGLRTVASKWLFVETSTTDVSPNVRLKSITFDAALACWNPKYPALQRFDAFLILYEVFGIWSENEDFITRKLLPFVNKFLPTKVLRGCENGSALIKYMEMGADKIFVYEDPTSHWRTYWTLFLRIPNTDTYIAAINNPCGHRSEVTEVDPCNRETWDYCVKKPVTPNEARAFCINEQRNNASSWAIRIYLNMDPEYGNRT